MSLFRDVCLLLLVGSLLPPAFAARIVEAVPAKARYAPGEAATINVRVDNRDGGAVNGRLEIALQDRGHTVLSASTDAELPAAAERSFALTVTPPAIDFRGYRIDVRLTGPGGEELARGAGALDVSSNWSRFPRYGYLSHFDAGLPADEWIAGLNRFHINGIQFYDVQHKHHMPVPAAASLPKSWPDVAGRTIHRDTVLAFLKEARARNMTTMAYNASYAAWWDALEDGSGVKLEWATWSDAAGPRTKDAVKTFRLPDGWATPRLMYMNQRSPAWQQYLFGRMEGLFRALPFDGWHIDTFGASGAYAFDGSPIDFVAGLPEFVNAARAALKRPMVVNTVSSLGAPAMTRSAADFVYSELWPSEQPAYPDILAAADAIHAAGPDRGIVFPAYLENELVDKLSASGSTTAFNIPTVLLADAVIFASGASHLELGGGGRMLSRPYFPNDTVITVSPELRERLGDYYDFLVAYENYLSDGAGPADTPVHLDGAPHSNTGQAGAVWTIARRNGPWTMVHFLNLLGLKTNDWRDDTGTHPAPPVLRNLRATVVLPAGCDEAGWASPDVEHGRWHELKPRKTSTGAWEIDLPYLNYWTIVMFRQPAAPLYQGKQFTVLPDRVIEGAFESRAVSRTSIESSYPPSHTWNLRADLSAYPRFHSGLPLADALYNLSLEELRDDIRPDGAFMAGREWEGVWTRDISYSIVLSLAAVEPEAAKASLLRKVQRGRIVQDTGTGGSWPVSTDRMTWALAAWEVYLVTGDRAWLRESFDIIRNSAEDDRHVAFSPSTGLALGESSFLDWREQTYPRWMNPADIYSATALGTNAVHYRTYRILAAMARALGEPPRDYDQVAGTIRSAMNKHLWLNDRGYYGQYLYGRAALSLSPRAEALGEALAVLFDIADEKQQDTILASVPVLDYGVPCVYPQTPGIPPYHNRAIWPFVQAYWNLAAAKRGNTPALAHGLASLWRAAALFLTNKENMVADTGSPVGTEINSSRQLWSVAGNLAMFYRVLIGMEFHEDGIRIRPVIPRGLDGVQTLENFRYRKAVLSFRVEGHGTVVRSIELDGRPAGDVIPATLEGPHAVVVTMAGDDGSGALNLVADATAPDTPVAHIENGKLAWNRVPGASRYRVFRDGRPLAVAEQPEFTVAGTGEFQVLAVGASGVESFLSEPLAVRATEPSVSIDGAAVEVTVREAGRYSASFRYANGSGPINTDNKCGIRTLYVDGKPAGPIVLPQRGTGAWNDWGTSSTLPLTLSAGTHRFELRQEPWDTNMDGTINKVVIERLQLVPVE